MTVATPQAVALVPTEYRHASEGCGERLPSPHAHCQARVAPYLAAERLRLPFAIIVLCLPCRRAWREVAA